MQFLPAPVSNTWPHDCMTAGSAHNSSSGIPLQYMVATTTPWTVATRPATSGRSLKEGDSEAMGGGVSSCVQACTVLDACGLLCVCSDAPRVHCDHNHGMLSLLCQAHDVCHFTDHAGNLRIIAAIAHACLYIESTGQVAEVGVDNVFTEMHAHACMRPM